MNANTDFFVKQLFKSWKLCSFLLYTTIVWLCHMVASAMVMCELVISHDDDDGWFMRKFTEQKDYTFPIVMKEPCHSKKFQQFHCANDELLSNYFPIRFEWEVLQRVAVKVFAAWYNAHFESLPRLNSIAFRQI